MRDLIATLELVETTRTALARVVILQMLMLVVVSGARDRVDSIIDMTALKRLLWIDARQGSGIRLRIRAAGIMVKVVTTIHVGCHLQTRRIRLVF